MELSIKQGIRRGREPRGQHTANMPRTEQPPSRLWPPLYPCHSLAPRCLRPLARLPPIRCPYMPPLFLAPLIPSPSSEAVSNSFTVNPHPPPFAWIREGEGQGEVPPSTYSSH